MNERPAIRILSAGAPMAGVEACAKAHAKAGHYVFEIERATAPVLAERLASSTTNADIIVAPLVAIEKFAKTGEIDPARVAPIGAVTIGVVVRNGAVEPDLGSVEAFKQAVLNADTIVYNLASSGQYVAKMLDKLGLAERLAAKTVIVATGAQVMERLAMNKSANELGFAHITEICRHDDLGTHLVGPLPGAIGRQTLYGVGLLASALQRDNASGLVDFMASAEGKRIFTANGVI